MSRGQILGPVPEHYKAILTPEAVAFLVAIHQKFDNERLRLLELRQLRQKQIDRGVFPRFNPETEYVREGTWKCAPIPADLQDRRVEITGPVSRKMVINALNCGAKTFMADFEDANSPTWENNIEGQINLCDAVRRTISFKAEKGKEYKLNDQVAVLIVRPRGLHLPENHFVVEGRPMSGSFFDFALYFFHNAQELLKRGSGPYFYLPKMESHLEARLWNSVFCFAESYLNLGNVIRATALIETIMAAFEMDEILFELRDHSAGLNCGRWDYIFSVIKKFIKHSQFVMGDRKDVTMTAPFMDAYVRLLIKTCHKRGVHAMGGMAAQIPIKDNKEAHEAALTKVRADKLREVQAGHDGTWVAHPGLIPTVLEVWNPNMPTPNQIATKPRSDVVVTEKDLLNVPQGKITEAGIRMNCEVSMLYLQAWLLGNGCVPIHNVMEDLATVEISRSQLYQWILHQARIDTGKKVTRRFALGLLNEEYNKLADRLAKDSHASAKDKAALLKSRDILESLLGGAFQEFMSLPVYPLITHTQTPAKL